MLNNRRVFSVLFLLLFTILLLNIPINLLSASPNGSEIPIFSEDFEGIFPVDNSWEVGDFNYDEGEDYWGSTDYRANGGSRSGWCAQIGTKLVPSFTIFTEDFEDGFGDGINGWSVGDSNPSGPTVYWNEVSSTFGGEGTHSGSYKAYCAGYGYEGSYSSPRYQNNMDVYMKRTVNLTGYIGANVTFWYQMPSIEDDYGQLLVGEVEVEKYETTQTTWTNSTVQLTDYVGSAIDLIWNFKSNSTTVAEGWYIDDISITVYPDVDNKEIHQYDNDMDSYMKKHIDLSDYKSATLQYYYWLDCETDKDYLRVQISYNEVSWDTQEEHTGNSTGWQLDSLDLSSFAGYSIYLRFIFESNDTFCDLEGAYLDDIQLTGTHQNDASSGVDAGDEFDYATPIDAGSYQGDLLGDDVYDYYKVYVSASNVINVDMTPPSGSDFNLALYDPDEEFVSGSFIQGNAMDSISYTVETSGNYFISVYYVSGSSTYELIIEIEDNIPPTLSITSPIIGSDVKSSTVEVTWTGSDVDTGIDHYEVKLDGGSWINVLTATNYDFTGVSDGSHTVYVKAIDGGDNMREAIVNFTVSTGIFGLDLTTIAIIGIIIVAAAIIIIILFILRG